MPAGPARGHQSALKEITVPLIGSTITPIVVFLPADRDHRRHGSFFSRAGRDHERLAVHLSGAGADWTPNLSQYFIKGRHEQESAASEEFTPPRRNPSATDAGSRSRTRWICSLAEEKHLERILPARSQFPRALAAPRARTPGDCSHCSALALIAVSYVCFNFSGSDLLPEMDEGGFVLDYLMPAGSSLAETNRVVSHVEQMLRDTPEVESTSRRTGLQLGLAAVTEANYGDIPVKLKAKRDRGIDEIMADVRAQIAEQEPAARCRVHTGSAGHDRRSDVRSGTDPDQVVFARSETTGRLGAAGR